MALNWLIPLTCPTRREEGERDGAATIIGEFTRERRRSIRIIRSARAAKGQVEPSKIESGVKLAKGG
jgi:hypothetical protein